MSFPKIIWIYWDKGWDAAPELSQRAFQSWQQRNPDYSICRIDLAAVDTLVPGWYQDGLPATITPTALSNLVRLALLRKFGGVWVDATTFCVQPLSQWIPPFLANGFFAFADPGPDRPLATWFMAAAADSPLIREWERRSRAYWQDRTAMDEFHWVHRRFQEMLKEDAESAALWNASPYFSAKFPLHLGPGRPFLHDPPSKEILEAVTTRTYPVCKLTNRRELGPENGTLNWLSKTLSQPLAQP